MSNPVLAEVIRGPLVESRHCGAVAVLDAEGHKVFSVGDIAAPVFPRSAIKAFQALPLVESGAAERYGFGDEALALACASHSGEPAHIAGVEQMLARAGLSPAALRCGAHWPMEQTAAAAVARAGGPSALHNNCSGKHAGFLCLACAALGQQVCAIDGCSVPTWALPLDRLAHGFAKFGTGRGLAPERARAAARLREACARQPWFVAGTGRFCAEVMQHFGRRVFVKTGAEGVYCGALPEQGLGIAIKCDDGAARAAQAIMAKLIARFLPLDAADRAALEPFVCPVLHNWNGFEVGVIRTTDAL